MNFLKNMNEIYNSEKVEWMSEWVYEWKSIYSMEKKKQKMISFT